MAPQISPCISLVWSSSSTQIFCAGVGSFREDQHPSSEEIAFFENLPQICNDLIFPSISFREIELKHGLRIIIKGVNAPVRSGVYLEMGELHL